MHCLFRPRTSAKRQSSRDKKKAASSKTHPSRIIITGLPSAVELSNNEKSAKRHALSRAESLTVSISTASLSTGSAGSTSSISGDDTSSSSSTDRGLTTQIQDFTEAFQEAFEPGMGDIYTVLLLSACLKYYELLKKIGNYQVAADFRNNIQKVEAVYKKAPANQRKTMSALLAYEKATGCHQNGILKDNSAAMGFLWMRRNLALQCEMCALVVESGKEPLDAAIEAYRQEVKPFFGWAARKAFKLGLECITPRTKDELYSKLGGFESSQSLGCDQEAATVADLRSLLSTWRPLIAKWKQIFLELDLEETAVRV